MKKKRTSRPSLVRNKESLPSKSIKKGLISQLTIHAIPRFCRFDTLEDREYIVVPMVILTEGVHNGSSGPIYYTSEELAKIPEAWDHKPVVVYHPEMNGKGVSACRPDVINTHKVGIMLNTKFENNRLKSEAWIEKSRAEKVDDRIMQAIETNTMMELSTGVYIDLEEVEGEWNGESYIGIARNFKPDHLALLPDKQGACSIGDGAGFLRNQALNDPEVMKRVAQVLEKSGRIDNELSMDSIRAALATELREKHNTTYDGPFLFVEDIFPQSQQVIYEWDGKLYKLDYLIGGEKVSLSDDEPVEVRRVMRYETVEGGTFVGNQNPTESKIMNKKKLVDSIIKNGAGWTEDDRKQLMEFNEDRLQLIANIKPVEGSPPADPTPKAPAEDEDGDPPSPKKGEKVPAKTQNQDPPKPLTAEEYIAAAPPQVREVLGEQMVTHQEEKTKVIDAIMANERNTFTKEMLEDKPLRELRMLATLAAPKEEPETNHRLFYGGQAPVPSSNRNVEEPLEMARMSFDDDK